jgi:hypothetical protein
MNVLSRNRCHYGLTVFCSGFRMREHRTTIVLSATYIASSSGLMLAIG